MKTTQYWVEVRHRTTGKVTERYEVASHDEAHEVATTINRYSQDSTWDALEAIVTTSNVGPGSDVAK